MNKRKRVACFFTGGYTELVSMKTFIGKINPNVDYRQLSPKGRRTSKKQIQNRKTRTASTIEKRYDGLTGAKLIDYILEHIKTKQFKDEMYDAILIEDDKDDRFLDIDSNGTSTINMDIWQEFKQTISTAINKIYPDIKVIFLFAAPEVEAWFLADWGHSFSKVYSDMFDANVNKHFEIVLKKYLNENVLTDIYAKNIESYGYFDGKYRKLSENIQAAIDSKELWQNFGYVNKQDQEEIKNIQNIDAMKDISEIPDVHYSKVKQGQEMLGEIEPEVVLKHCNKLFKEGYIELCKL